MTINTINKTTLNYANKRGLDLTYWDDEETTIAIWKLENECEPLCFYSIGDLKGSYFYKSNCILRREISEELPYWIKSELHFRRMLDFLSVEVKKNIKRYA